MSKREKGNQMNEKMMEKRARFLEKKGIAYYPPVPFVCDCPICEEED